MANSGFNEFTVKAKLSWYDGDLTVRYYSYILAQYLPSIYANIILFVERDRFNDFKAMDNLPLSSRTVELWFQPELILNGESYFSGNYKFICVNCEYQNVGLSDVVADDNTKSGSGYFIVLHCIDKVYYNMTLDKKFKAYQNQAISDVVKEVVTSNGGQMGEVISTDYKYTWLQSQMTDYEMIRSLLPYARSINNELIYNILFLNEKCHFVPITHGFNTDEKIIIDVNKANNVNYMVSDNKANIEKYGSLDNLYCISHGYTDFDYVKAEKASKQSYISNNTTPKQHSGIATQYINTALEDKELQKIYVSNLRQRINSFNTMMEISTTAIPDITCYNMVEVINQDKGVKHVLDNLYYILAIKYEYYNRNSPEPPTMHMCLSSEFDYGGTASAEGQGVHQPV